MLDETSRGVFTIAATPFLPNGALDLDSLDRLIDAYVERGATGLTILGMMGEAGKLTAAESLVVTRRVIARTAVPVIVGVSQPGLAAMGELAAEAMAAGASGVMVAPPSSLRTDAQITGYYHDTARTLGDIPFVLQDFPLVTGVQVPVQVILRIVADCPTCVMLKHEDWPGLDKISALRAASDGGARRISILCGNGGLYLLEEMLRGADGAMTGFGYPEMMARVVGSVQAGEVERARDIFDAYMPMIRYEAQPGIGLAIRKYTLMRQGIIAHATLRRPGPALTPATMAEVDALAERQARRLSELGL
jgi:4-hydroxy-tetrahydrodipicolinate synthase